MVTEGFAAQRDDRYRFDWGAESLEAVGADAAVVVIVDVLRFTTAVCCALEAGGTVLPFPWDHPDAAAYAAEHGAVLAGLREHGGPSLSPTDLLTSREGQRLVLPSPNGSFLSVTARSLGVPFVLAGCLRNATATARAATELSAGGPIAVIASGERWPAADGSKGPLRPSVEDLLGAGAVLAALDPAAAQTAPRCSPEAAAARAAFVAARPRLYDALTRSSSGRELIGRGWEDDVATSAAHDVSEVVCLLEGPAYIPR